MARDCGVAADELHVPDLPLARVPKGAIWSKGILIPVRLTRLPGEQEDERSRRWSGDSALHLAGEATMNVSSAPVNLANGEGVFVGVQGNLTPAISGPEKRSAA